MAKLKIVKAGTADTADVDGYIALVDNLILNGAKYTEFVEAGQSKRADLLQAAVYPKVVTQLDEGGTFDPISKDNCKIDGEPDEKGDKGNAKKSKVTVGLPDVPPMDFTTYLSDYATAICDLYKAGRKEDAHKFMFGMMLITRCR